MEGQVDYITLVETARRGDKESLNELAGIARERLRVYVYRLTLQEDLTQEIVQESLLEMCRVLGKLKRTDRFWSWLYGIATNKLRRHHRTERALRNAAAHEERRRGPMKERQGGLENMVSQELKQIISGAMQKLRTRHKAVLVMRCYDEMSYAEIADSMGCSEFSTRMLFMRAKRALQKELSRNGFSKGSLLAALVVFGKITAPSKAAAAQLTVPAVTLKAGTLAGMVGLATTKTAIISMTAAGALTVGAVATKTGPAGWFGGPSSSPTAHVQLASPLETLNGGPQKYYYYFPEGSDGPVMLRAEPEAEAGRLNRRVLQNQYANHNFQGNVVHINNHRAWSEDLRVFRLPTDSPALRASLAKVEGAYDGPEPIAARGKDLLVVVERDESSDSQPWTVRHQNVLEEDYFQSDWRSGARMVDHRDAMHYRGWTYFRVSGEVNGRNVRGTGRIPFVYGRLADRRPWLKLKVAGELTVVDTARGAHVADAEGEIVSKLAAGSFFHGLARPWMGLHAMDTVRRDAARQKMQFETAFSADGSDVLITVARGRTELVYTVDLETDVVEKIELFADDAPVGHLDFEYLQELENGGTEFAAPRATSRRMSLTEGRGMRWLVELADGTLGR